VLAVSVATPGVVLIMLTGLVDPKLKMGKYTAPEGLVAMKAVRVTLPVKPPAGVIEMAEVLPVDAPRTTVTAVPVSVKLTVIGAALIVIVVPDDVPPVVVTVTLAEPAAAIRPAGTAAVSRVALT
jgi:hypothetical protein